MADTERNVLQTAPPNDPWELVLFVTREDDQTRLVRTRLERLLEKYLTGRYRAEVFNILKEPEKGYQFDVIVTPTLIRLKPEPPIRLIGDLSEAEKVLHALGLDVQAEPDRI